MASMISRASGGHPRRSALSPLGDAANLRISSGYDGVDRITVRVDGEVDVATVDQLRTSLDVAIGKGVRQVVVDLRGVTFLSSDGLDCLARGTRGAGAAGCRLYTIATARVVVRSIEITGLANAVRLRDDPATVPSPAADV
jgi:anti-anti-sigma factor